MEQQDWESVNFEEMMQKAVKAKTKAGLRSSTMVQDSDIRCPKGHCLSNNTTSKMQIQGIIAKDFSCPKEPKAKEINSVRVNVVELFELTKKEDK